MRNAWLLGIAAAAAVACGTSPTENDTRLRLPPPTLQVTATVTQEVVAGERQLLVSALVRNRTSTRLSVSVGGQCPLFVSLVPDPQRQLIGSTSASMRCPAGSSTLDVLPGDSATLSRLLPPDFLTPFQPGTYSVNVAVTTSNALIGVVAGDVDLPLAP